MKTEYVLNMMTAIDWWCRPDLGPKPENSKRVADVLREAEIKVYEVSGGWLECEPRPAGIWEALTGKLADQDWVKKFNCPLEQPGQVLKLLAEKGIPVDHFDKSSLEKS